MTNAEKFIEVMNKTFNAGFTQKNLIKTCIPWKSKREDAPCFLNCQYCHEWWDTEYAEPVQQPGDEPFNRQWVSVEDRLPDKELQEAISQSRNFVDFEGTPQIEVLVMVAWAKRPTILWYDGAEFYDDDFNNYRVSYWMPLPEPRIKGTACQ